MTRDHLASGRCCELSVTEWRDRFDVLRSDLRTAVTTPSMRAFMVTMLGVARRHIATAKAVSNV